MFRHRITFSPRIQKGRCNSDIDGLAVIAGCATVHVKRFATNGAGRNPSGGTEVGRGPKSSNSARRNWNAIHDIDTWHSFRSRRIGWGNRSTFKGARSGDCELGEGDFKRLSRDSQKTDPRSQCRVLPGAHCQCSEFCEVGTGQPGDLSCRGWRRLSTTFSDDADDQFRRRANFSSPKRSGIEASRTQNVSFSLCHPGSTRGYIS